MNFNQIRKVKSFTQKIPFVYSLGYSAYGLYWLYKATHNNRRTLKNIMFQITSRCNSRCKHCYIWDKPGVDLAPDVIEQTINSKVVDKLTFLGMEGGEVLMHPKYKEILSLFSGRNYVLLTNGVMPKKFIDTVREFKVKNISLSLDGTKETNKAIRGVDCYDGVIQIIDELKDEADIFVTFTFSPWNTKEDFLHVRNLCREKGVKFGYNIYSDMHFLDTKKKIEKIDYADSIKTEDLSFKYYNRWVDGKVKIPCLSINYNVKIRPNGDVSMCYYKDIVLGNIYKQNFTNIWVSERTKKLQKQYRSCNECWVSSHRGYDIKFVHHLESVFPKSIVRKLIGNYKVGE